MTDLKEMENEVRAIKKDGLLWGACMTPCLALLQYLPYPKSYISRRHALSVAESFVLELVESCLP